MNIGQKLVDKINKKEARVGIIGMGYVGSALAQAITKADFLTTGFENSAKRKGQIHKNQLHNLSVTSDKSLLADCDIVLICVQTPVFDDKTPDLSIFIRA